MTEPSESQASDRIERSILIDAPRAKVWQLLSDAERFGRWFGADLKGQTFAPGQVTRGPITIEGYTHILFEVKVERVEPQQLLSWRWHPYAVDPAVDYSGEEPTLVTWTLHDAPNNATLVRTVESGFDQVPPHRRLEAFRMNSGGWTAQLENIRRHAEAAR
ncbi:SRPBCC family protein [Ramlibacter tataouinensis]|uniref:SRPBCC family protein n=1 Tax=Ramlibacter tataouinensis TaxID=94132 RepID=UPI0022F40088|nr:SRPBCC family protein [Ramlibacter tataouinensis]WBY01402.1 SRPBCC family protein [Ramlibacter tataouinensis]